MARRFQQILKSFLCLLILLINTYLNLMIILLKVFKQSIHIIIYIKQIFVLIIIIYFYLINMDDIPQEIEINDYDAKDIIQNYCSQIKPGVVQVNKLENNDILSKISSQSIIKRLQKKRIINQQSRVQVPYQTNHKLLQHKYYNFFRDVIPDPESFSPAFPSDEDFKLHKIKYLKGNQFHQSLQAYDQPYIRIKNTQQFSTIVIYSVIIAMFELEITLLNINQQSKQSKNEIGKGTFGNVRIQWQNRRIFAVKRQMFQKLKANKYEIDQVIIQLCIYKLCSLFKIGPAAETSIGFDLICYKDCIEFQIELCIKIEYRNNDKREIFVDKRKFAKQIKQCLLILHFYKIIHKDIKPANILFSIKYNKYVLTDFGLSHTVVQKIGYHSLTHFQGTMRYMSQQMLSLQKKQTGYVDLYGNDVYALKKSLKIKTIDQKIEQGLKKFKQKWQQFQELNKYYQYEYLKLKYFCIKPSSKMGEVQHYWKFMNSERTNQLILIVDKSMDYDKIKSVYMYLSNFKQSKEYKLDSLRTQSQSINSIKIVPDIKQITQLQLKNTLRVYGYCQYVKEIINKLKLQQKYEDLVMSIDKILDEYNEVNYRDIMFGNHINHIKSIKIQLNKCHQIEDYEGMFNRYMVILQYGNIEEQIDVIKKLKTLKYERKQSEKIKQQIRVSNIQKNMDNPKKYLLLQEQKDEHKQKIQIKKKLAEHANISRPDILQSHGQMNSDAAKLYNNRGVSEMMLGNYELALKYLVKTVQISLKLYGEQHQFVAQIYNNMANIYDSMSNHQTALTYHNKIIDIYLKIHGQQHPKVAEEYSNIASLYNRMHEYKKALIYHDKSIDIYILLYGQQHTNVAIAYKNMAMVYHSMDQYETAIMLCIKSLRISYSLYGYQHINVAKIFYSIAFIHQTYDPKLALQYCCKSIKIQFNLSIKQYAQLACNYKLLSNIFLKQKIYSKSLHFAKIALITFLKINPLEHPQSLQFISLIAQINQNINRFNKAYLLQVQNIRFQQNLSQRIIKIQFNQNKG